MSTYLLCIKTVFRKNVVFRVDYILGIISTCLQIFISCAIWKALYGKHVEINGISLAMVTTNFVIGLGLTNAFRVDDSVIQRKLRDGSFANELLKPINIRAYILAENLGDILFRILTNFLPSFIIAVIFIGVLPPVDAMAVCYSMISVVLGFGVFWALSSIIQMTAFWVMNVWSLSTIKNVFVNVLAGALLPLWFMPSSIMKIIKFTPFDSIYFTPVQIYLGELSGGDVWVYYGRQALWIVLLYSVSTVLWVFGRRRIVIQGG